MCAADLVRDYASTGHLAKCLVSLLEAQAAGAFDIGSGQPRALGDLARITADAASCYTRLHLSHRPNSADPLRMSPDLYRLSQVTEFSSEMPEDALWGHVTHELKPELHSERP